MLTDRDNEFLKEISSLVLLNYESFVLDKRTGNYNIKINFLRGSCVNFKEFSEKTIFSKIKG